MQKFIKTLISAIQAWTKKEIKKTEDRIVDSTADWNENDSSKDSYIKNRTHWEEVKQKYLIPETSVFISEDYGDVSLSNSLPLLTIGQEYIVVLNGTTYKCIAREYDGSSAIIGNGTIYGDDNEGNGEPFSCDSYDDGSIYLNVATAGKYTISISIAQTEIHKIDRKYIDMPDNIATTDDIQGIIGEVESEKIAREDADAAKMDKENPVGTGSFSMNRRRNSTVGQYSTAIGNNAEASGYCSHAEGSDTTASSSNSHAEGQLTIASGYASHAEGYRTSTASGATATANISTSLGAGYVSHVEGYGSVAPGAISHAEGNGTAASGLNSHAEGYRTTASGDYSHAEGYWAVASDTYSHAEGSNTIAKGTGQHVQGICNIEDTAETYAHIVGNGASIHLRSNAHTLDWNGVGWFQGGLQVGGNAQDDGAKNVLVEGDAIPVPSAAQVGQLLSIKAIDENGKPTEWEAADAVKTVNGIAPDENGNVELDAGISPSAIVEQTESGAVISITDKDGTTTATITNGQRGRGILHVTREPYVWNDGEAPYRMPLKTIISQAGVNEVLVGDIVQHGCNQYKVLELNKDDRLAYLDNPVSIKGVDGTDGTNGKSAYEYAQEAGYTGTKTQFAKKLASDNGVSSWNALSDKPFYEMDTLFDGNTSGHEVVMFNESMNFVKMNDHVFTEEECIGKVASVYIEANDTVAELSVSANGIADLADPDIGIPGFLVFPDELMTYEIPAVMILKEPVSTDYFSLSAGTYYAIVNSDSIGKGHTTYFSAFDDVVTLKKLDEKYLPDSVALKSDIPSIEGLASEEYVDNAIANLPTGGGSSSEWEFINRIELTEDVLSSTVEITADANGNPFSYKEIFIVVYGQAPSGKSEMFSWIPNSSWGSGETASSIIPLPDSYKCMVSAFATTTEMESGEYLVHQYSIFRPYAAGGAGSPIGFISTDAKWKYFTKYKWRGSFAAGSEFILFGRTKA